MSVLFSARVHATAESTPPAAPPVADAQDTTYRIEALGERGAEVAASQLLLADLSNRGLRAIATPVVQLTRPE